MGARHPLMLCKAPTGTKLELPYTLVLSTLKMMMGEYNTKVSLMYLTATITIPGWFFFAILRSMHDKELKSLINHKKF